MNESTGAIEKHHNCIDRFSTSINFKKPQTHCKNFYMLLTSGLVSLQADAAFSSPQPQLTGVFVYLQAVAPLSSTQPQVA